MLLTFCSGKQCDVKHKCNKYADNPFEMLTRTKAGNTYRLEPTMRLPHETECSSFNPIHSGKTQ